MMFHIDLLHRVPKARQFVQLYADDEERFFEVWAGWGLMCVLWVAG